VDKRGSFTLGADKREAYTEVVERTEIAEKRSAERFLPRFAGSE
jgi:hypothetical protein